MLDKFIGGNSIEFAQEGPVRDFVIKNKGHTVITRVLIANNGLGAVKEMRSVRQWAYNTFNDDRAIKFIVMASSEDLQANAEYIRMADQYVEVPGGSNNINYANVDLIVDIAERTGAHAVWAGWGHASENPHLPEKLLASKSKIVFIGPPASAMRSLGDKISSTIVAQSAQVPTMPWSGDGIDETYVNSEGCVEVSEDVYLKATTSDFHVALEQAKRIGFPVMIKASEGGGGKGIRMAHSEDSFETMFKMCQNEVPGSPIFIMKLASESRHLEVQLLADQYGNAISLFGRDCSVQRRHQKIIEEAPAIAAPKKTFNEMEKAAVRLAKLVGYVSAGTVEYLYLPSDDKFYFLELNPRLQVEHPTTEMVSGVNLPAAQLLVAMGIPLNLNQDIRRLYGVDVNGNSEIDFDFDYSKSTPTNQSEPEPIGHVIACRITAENPEAGFKPSSGSLQTLSFKSFNNVWGYFSVSPGSGLHEFADSQFGHIFAYGETREKARQSMVVSLKEMSIQGEFRTTIGYLITLLELPDFRENHITTAWLDGLISSHLSSEKPDTFLTIICGAACKAYGLFKKLNEECIDSLKKGQMLTKNQLINVFDVEFIYEDYRYIFKVFRTGDNLYTLEINGSRVQVELRTLSDGGILVSVNGTTHPCYTHNEVGSLRLQIDEYVVLLLEDADPTILRSQSPGKLIRYCVESGSRVKEGEAYAEIEVMKMIMPILSSEQGIVHFIKPAGSVIAAGETLGTLTLDDPSKVKKALLFTDPLPGYSSPKPPSSKPHQQMSDLIAKLNNILDGFYETEPVMDTLHKLSDIFENNPEVPYLIINDMLSAMKSRIPQSLENSILYELEKASKHNEEFPAKKILSIIDKALKSVDISELPALSSSVKTISDTSELYIDGFKSYKYTVYTDLINKYYNNETLFSSKDNEETAIQMIRSLSRENTPDLIRCLRSHAGVRNSSNLIYGIMKINKLLSSNSNFVDFKYEAAVKSLASLTSSECSKVALKARGLLIESQVPSLKERERQMEQILTASVSEYVYGRGLEYHPPVYDILKNLIDSNYYVFDVLQTFFYHRAYWVRLASIETYIRRAYHIYSIADVEYITDLREPYILRWAFYLPADALSILSPISKEEKSSMMRVMSVSDLTTASESSNTEASDKLRYGVMSSFDDFDSMKDGFDLVLNHLPLVSDRGSATPSPIHSRNTSTSSFSKYKSSLTPMSSINTKDKQLSPDSKPFKPKFSNVLNIAFQVLDELQIDSDFWAKTLEEFTKSYMTLLRKHGVRRVTYLLSCHQNHPSSFTYSENTDFSENTTIRNIEPALAYQLELSRLSNYNIVPYLDGGHHFHTYIGTSKKDPTDTRVFLRALVRQGTLKNNVQTIDYLISETDRLLSDILDSLEILIDKYPNLDCNHLFINFLPIFDLDSSQFEPAYRGFLERHGTRLFRLRVSAAEIRFTVQMGSPNDPPTPIRFCIFNELGFVPKLESYLETVNPDSNEWYLHSLDSPPGSLDNQPISTPYTTRDIIQPRRYKAHKMGTAFVYDYPSLFNQALLVQWRVIQKKNSKAVPPLTIFNERELVWDSTESRLIEVSRPPGKNRCGMVAWLFEMFTPENPTGRKIVVIANDITFKIGSFGVDEDLFFYQVSAYARANGLPRIYLSANSGARIGLAEEVRDIFKSDFIDPSFPEKGFNYLYLDDKGKAYLDGLSTEKAPAVLTEEITGPDGDIRHKLTAIIGISDSLGVENLMGSGLIAGETSRAYEDIFTITLVTSRSVGIGAYLVRLGQRTIQNEGHPIILTGNNALNKVLGREVYTSNLQLGGTQIMYKNGVTHLTAKDDFVGINKILRWLSFVPPYKGAPIVPASLLSWDPIDRAVGYTPPKGPSDPRHFLAGVEINGVYQPGFFDSKSFVEVLGGWARTVVTGRARLGGIPTGVIAVETRTVENIVAADPANASSQEQVLLEAGGVWYPNSAFKTSQAIRDFNNGEGLPLFIFANWRGFSGGQRDMYEQILKFGSYIVDALTEYRQPVFVYIIPNGELRGGAWVVLDSSINSDVMEMYADSTSRGGVIEPEGIVEIKYRKPKIIETMDRLDGTLKSLKQKLHEADAQEKPKIQSQIDQRVKILYPVYLQIAVGFADLHDRPGRMLAKKTIKKILDWKTSRKYFYHRLRRRLVEDRLRSEIKKLNPTFSREEQIKYLQMWFINEKTKNEDPATIKQILSTDLFKETWECNDEEMWEWYESNYSNLIKKVNIIAKKQKLTELQELATKNSGFALEAASMLLGLLDEESKAKLIGLAYEKDSSSQ
ncbi:Acetyl-CoA carboxylase [Smittium mucronatum]|uniref:Acetyl-CoA carboxylase n=1 Tax=Smittium mucronatum TaxID=133383 RepID=A0A1R0GLJ1_9FUNG|nr:Acetyl-CoA carboxylase [Smittium mucronatum]